MAATDLTAEIKDADDLTEIKSNHPSLCDKIKKVSWCYGLTLGGGIICLLIGVLYIFGAEKVESLDYTDKIICIIGGSIFTILGLGITLNYLKKICKSVQVSSTIPTLVNGYQSFLKNQLPLARQLTQPLLLTEHNQRGDIQVDNKGFLN